jgi:hypothetical protein
MSFKKNETSQAKMIKSKRNESPADTPRRSENPDSSLFSMKNISNADEKYSGLFSYKINSLSGKFNEEKKKELPKGFSERMVLMEMRDPRIQNLGLEREANFESSFNPYGQINEHDILENLRQLKYQKRAKLLALRKKLKRPRKASRVVSEGTKVESKDGQKVKDPEELLEESFFPQDQITQQDTIHKFMPQNKATHSRVSSAVFHMTPSLRNNKIEDLSLLEKKVSFKGLTPSKFVYSTPNKEDSPTFNVPPKLSKPSWQRKVQREIQKGEHSFMSSNEHTDFGNPFKYQMGLFPGNIVPTLASEDQGESIRSNVPNEYYRGFGERFLGRPMMFSGENVTATTATKIPNQIGGDRRSRLDRLLDSFKFARVEEEGSEDQSLEEITENGVLNPNVINFEQNPFDEIFGDKVVQNNQKEDEESLSYEQGKSKQSKASSNEPLF